MIPGRVLVMLAVLAMFVVFGGSAIADEFDVPAKKSESSALNAALGGTFTPIVLGALLYHFESDRSDFHQSAAIAIMATGAVIGPGLGHLYASNRSKFLTSTLIRSACAGVMLLGASISEDPIRSQTSGAVRHSQTDSGSGYALFFFGSLGFGIITVYDIVTTGASVDSYNEQWLSEGLNIQPVMRLGSRYGGLQLTLNF